MGDVGAGLIGLVAVILFLGIPMAAMYTYFRVKKLKTDERMAAIARGVSVPFEEPVAPAPDGFFALSRRRAGWVAESLRNTPPDLPKYQGSG